MNFDPRDLIDANLSLLQEASQLETPEPAVLMTVATWGRGADPKLLEALQPYRHGLGFNGSIVARVPLPFAREWLPEEVQVELAREESGTLIYGAVFKNWALDRL